MYFTHPLLQRQVHNKHLAAKKLDLLPPTTTLFYVVVPMCGIIGTPTRLKNYIICHARPEEVAAGKKCESNEK